MLEEEEEEREGRKTGGGGGRRVGEERGGQKKEKGDEEKAYDDEGEVTKMEMLHNTKENVAKKPGNVAKVHRKRPQPSNTNNLQHGCGDDGDDDDDDDEVWR